MNTQNYTSANTSINGNKLPTAHKRLTELKTNNPDKEFTYDKIK